MQLLPYSDPLLVAQIFSITCGLLDLVLTVTSFKPWPDEECFLAIVIIALLCVGACAIGDRFYLSESTKLIDMIVYALSGGSLAISSIIMLTSAIRVTEGLTTMMQIQRILSAVLGFANGIVLCSAGLVLLRELQNSIYPISLTKSKFLVIEWDRVKSSNVAGKLQVALLVVGIVDLGITAHSYFRYSEEIVFLVIVSFCFVLSFMEFLGGLFGLTKTDDAGAFISLSIAHVIGGMVLLSGGIVMIVAVVDKGWDSCEDHCNFAPYEERIISGILGAVNGILYGLTAYALFSASSSVRSHETAQYDWDYEDLPPVDP